MKKICIVEVFRANVLKHALLVPVHREEKRVVVLRLHDTVARSRTGMKFSLRDNNRSELAPLIRSGMTFSGGIM